LICHDIVCDFRAIINHFYAQAVGWQPTKTGTEIFRIKTRTDFRKYMYMGRQTGRKEGLTDLNE